MEPEPVELNEGQCLVIIIEVRLYLFHKSNQFNYNMANADEDFAVEEIYGVIPYPCPNHELVYVIDVYLSILIDQHDINLLSTDADVKIIQIHHLLKEIIIRSKCKHISGNLLYLMDKSMSETFHYDAIFRDKDEADEYFLCIHNDIELCLADKIRNL